MVVSAGDDVVVSVGDDEVLSSVARGVVRVEMGDFSVFECF
jgi:hypothetical protein